MLFGITYTRGIVNCLSDIVYSKIHSPFWGGFTMEADSKPTSIPLIKIEIQSPTRRVCTGLELHK